MQAFLDTMKRRGVSFLEMLAMEMKVLQLVLSHAHCQLFQTLMVAMYLRFALKLIKSHQAGQTGAMQPACHQRHIACDTACKPLKAHEQAFNEYLIFCSVFEHQC